MRLGIALEGFPDRLRAIIVTRAPTAEQKPAGTEPKRCFPRASGLPPPFIARRETGSPHPEVSIFERDLPGIRERRHLERLLRAREGRFYLRRSPRAGSESPLDVLGSMRCLSLLDPALEQSDRFEGLRSLREARERLLRFSQDQSLLARPGLEGDQRRAAQVPGLRPAVRSQPERR